MLTVDLAQLFILLSSSPGSLKDRHIENGAVIYAIFTPKENLTHAPQMPRQESGKPSGTDVIQCHIMLKVRFNNRMLLN